MKTKEFIKKVEALGYVVDDYGTNLIIMDSDGHDYATVSKKQRFVMDTDTFDFATYLNVEVAEKIATLVFEYSATPIADREEEKRYRLRLVAPILGDPRYLHYGGYSKTFSVACVLPSNIEDTFKTIFTASEIAEMDITGFEPEEVN